MYFKVKITKGLPQAKSGGFTGNNLNKQVISFGGADMNAASRHLENTRYLKQVPRDEANLEAEKGETAFGDINGDGFTEHMLIGGKRHSQGGTPLNLPDGTFIFSDTAAMKIKDPEILAKFGKKSGSFTPAELAKPYDINKYRKILEDPNSDKVDKKSAELMIKNINLKLGALALAQEAKKGFPQGIPEVAIPYMQQMGIREEDLIPQKPQPEAQVDQQAMQNPYENQGMGMQSPEEESMEQVQGMQNPQEEMMEMPPMAAYGMQMGGYDMPFAQSGVEMGPTKFDNINYDRNQTGMQEYLKTIQRYNELKGNPEFFPVGEGPVNIDQNRNYNELLNDVNNPGSGTAYDPETGEPLPPTNYTPQEYLEKYKQNVEDCPCMKTIVVRGVPQDKCVPCEQLEMAQYGMMMGDYSRPAQQLYRNGGSLNKFVDGGKVTYKIPENAVVINRADYDTDEDYQVARNEKFAKAGKNPVYILMPDGKYKKVTQKTKASDPYTGDDLGKTWNNSKEIAATFRDMNISINSPEFTKLLGKYTREAIKNPDKYKGKNQKTSKVFDTDFSKKEFKDEEIRDAFALHQKRNLALQANGIMARYFEDSPTGRLLTPEQMVAKKVLTDAGKPITLPEAKQIHDNYTKNKITDLGKAFDKVGIPLSNTPLEQATFQGFTDALTNKEKLTVAEQAALKGWSGYETGQADETGQTNARISPIDDVYTNTTGEQTSGYIKPAENEFVETDVDGEPVIDQTVIDDEDSQAIYQGNPEWWKQDKVNLGLAAADYFDVDKALPWAARYEPELMDPTFYDPTRELAAQSEQANIANNAMAQFLGPQAASARSASVQGQGAKQAADTLSRYNNLNVGVANQFEGNNAQITNEAQRFNQAQNKQLYDQNTIANQQYKNTKRALRHNLGQAYNTGVTNMMQTDAMNQMYPQYAVDPRSGGYMHFTKGKDLNPTMSEDAYKYAQTINKSNLPDRVQEKLITAYINKHGGYESGIPNMYASQAASLQEQKKGGTAQMAYVMGSNVFPFMFY